MSAKFSKIHLLKFSNKVGRAPGAPALDPPLSTADNSLNPPPHPSRKRCWEVNFTLSVCPVCGHDFDHAWSKGWVHGFFWKVVHSLSPSEDVHLDFSYWLDNFSSFYRFFSVFGLSSFFLKTRCSVLKIMKTFELNIKNVLLLNWNFVFTIMNYNIFKELCLFPFIL